MPRKQKTPPECLKFKEDVEKLGFFVMIERMAYTGFWSVSVLQGKICIWHNNSLSTNIPLETFWSSKAYLQHVQPK